MLNQLDCKENQHIDPQMKAELEQMRSLIRDIHEDDHKAEYQPLHGITEKEALKYLIPRDNDSTINYQMTPLNDGDDLGFKIYEEALYFFMWHSGTIEISRNNEIERINF
jgi:hypothetical protein